jgi:hypothetical protein
MAMPPIEALVSAHCLDPLPNRNVTNSRPGRQGGNAPARVVRHFGAGQESDHRLSRLLRARRERPCSRCAAKQRDELAALHVDFALSLIASSVSVCHPASLIFTRATSVILPSVTMRSACADTSPARTSSTSSSAVNPFANISRLGAAVGGGGEQFEGAATVGLGAVARAAVGFLLVMGPDCESVV